MPVLSSGEIELVGLPIEIGFQPNLHIRRRKLREGPPGLQVHAASFIRERRIVLDSALRRKKAELQRIYFHELYHFAWVRLGNPRRQDYESLLRAEARRRVPGELGWSAESRKQLLRPSDWRERTVRWREYVCESFCDTGAWLHCQRDCKDCDEFTLGRVNREERRGWFTENGLDQRISI